MTGAAFALRESITNRALLAEANRLHHDFDQHCNKQPNQVFVKAIQTRGVHDYAWLVHLPKGYHVKRLINVTDEEVTLGNTTPLSYREIIVVRVSLQGTISWFTCRFMIGDIASNGFTISAKEEGTRLLFGEMVAGERPLQIEQLGTESIVEMSPSEEISLLDFSTKVKERDRNFSVLKLLPTEPQEKGEADDIR